MILWWKRYLKLRYNLKVSLLLCSKYILENESKKPVHQNWLRQTTKLQKLIMLKNDFKHKQIYFNEKLHKLRAPPFTSSIDCALG